MMLRDRPFPALTGITTVFAMTSLMLAFALPTVVRAGLDGPAWLASAILVGNTVLVSVLATPVVKRLAPYRRTRVITAAAALWALGCFLFSGFVPGQLEWVVPVLIGAPLPFTPAEVMHGPISMALATAIAPTDLRGRYLAAFQYSFTTTGIIAPPTSRHCSPFTAPFPGPSPARSTASASSPCGFWNETCRPQHCMTSQNTATSSGSHRR